MMKYFIRGGSNAESLCIQGQLPMDFQGPEMLTYMQVYFTEV